MIEIKHKDSGKVLHVEDAETLVKADLRYLNLDGADLEGADLRLARLSGTRLRSAKLNSADLSSANLHWAYMRGADLSDANLYGADMNHTILTEAILYRSNLSSCDLFCATFSRSEMKSANLENTGLVSAVFIGTRLDDTVLHDSLIGGTTFAFCDNLHGAQGLESVRHFGPSALDRHTLQQSLHKLPDVFLEGCGYSRHELETLRALYREGGIAFYSCFISHGEPDLPFAERLLADLRQNNVTCWHYKADMRGGEDQEDQINRAIKLHDKLILVCSHSSVYRKGVIKEILHAIKVERETGVQKLFPIRLDDHILGDGMMDEAREKVKSGEWAENWVYYATRKHIPDFSGWDKDNAKYQSECKKLLEALQKGVSAQS